MNSGVTSERVYDALKHRILHRMARPGERLDPAIIGEALSSSVTPVRDALHRLAGERLVATRTSEGFHLPHLDAPALEDLYAWTMQVFDLLLRTRGLAPCPPLRPADDHAGRVRALFEAIAARSGNLEHRAIVDALNDRLHAVRITEAEILTDSATQLAALADLARGDPAALRAGLQAWHRRRRRAAAAIVRGLYRAPRG